MIYDYSIDSNSLDIIKNYDYKKLKFTQNKSSEVETDLQETPDKSEETNHDKSIVTEIKSISKTKIE